MNAINTNTTVVLNGTYIASEMAEKFNGFARKTAESILLMAKVVSDMKAQALAQKDKTEFEKFCDLIGYKSDSSLIRKFTQIGGKFTRLMENVDKLPSTWTTVYQIALLNDDAIVTLLEKGVISPSLSGTNVKEVLGLSVTKTSIAVVANMPEVQNRTDAEFTFRARLSSFLTAQQVAKVKRIMAELKEINFEIETSSGMDIALEEPQLALAA